MEKKEYIICAAIYYDDGKHHPHQPKGVLTGVVVCGRRHHNCIGILSMIWESLDYKGNTIQGFLTNKDRFVNRSVAYTIARDADQLLLGDYQKNDEKYCLTSEDIY